MHHRGTGGDAFGWPLALLRLSLALSAAAAVDDNGHLMCPTNASEPAPEGARVVDGVLYAGNPEVAYQPSQYRAVQGGVGYRLCTSPDPKPTVFKCCNSREALVMNTDNVLDCTGFDELAEEFKVRST